MPQNTPQPSQQRRQIPGTLDVEASVQRAKRRVADIQAALAEPADTGTTRRRLEQRLLTAEAILSIVASPKVTRPEPSEFQRRWLPTHQRTAWSGSGGSDAAN